MIGVIADDLTGAAELGGIGLSKGLSVEIAFTVNPSSHADLLVIATDTRSKSQAEAVTDMIEITQQIVALKPKLIFKKVDSVLRGYVVPEITAQLKVLGFESALLVPANPVFGRTIENGSYLINDIPIAQTSFAADPEFPAKSSDILDLLKVSDEHVQVKKYGEAPLEKGITIAEVKYDADLKNWAGFYKDNVLLAGGSGFFRAVLNNAVSNSSARYKDNSSLSGTMLYVCGSAYYNSIKLVSNIAAKGGPVSYMPQAVCDAPGSEEELEKWCEEVLKLIAEKKKVIVAVNSDSTNKLSPLQLRIITALLVKKVFDRVSIAELIIEGGATASSILRTLGIETLYPVNEYATGVIRSKVIASGKLYVTLKPGSYTWPNQVWQF